MTARLDVYAEDNSIESNCSHW